ncbi:MAG: class I SAM-dependent methyltransferase [Planctomycetaceae bacterium]
MNVRPQLYLLLTLLAVLTGCGREPAAIDAPVPHAAAADSASDAAAGDIRANLGAMPATKDPFLSEEPSGDVETVPEFEESPDVSIDEQTTISLDEADDAVAADIPDVAVLASAEEAVEDAEEVIEENEPETSVKPQYTRSKIHDPNGIGKFYMGREIAHVMGYEGAAWLERTEREEEERLTLLMKALDLQPGQIVADIGAGSGVITLLMAERVGPEGQIIAVDVQQKMLDLLKRKLKQFGIKNVKLVKGTKKSPKLEPESIDLAIMVDVYHEFEFPYEMLLEISKALKPGGGVAFVEYRLEDPTVPIKLVHKMSVDQVKLEAEQPEFGLEYRETINILPRQHIVMFEKSEGSRDESPEPEEN